MAKWVLDFSEGSASMRDRLGGKGAGLAEMTRIGLPVPPGFTVVTEACRDFMATHRMPDGCWDQTRAGIQRLQDRTGDRLGDPARPLLVSVRSGAPVSMPGMMDTVLNLGLNAETVEGLARRSRDERFAWDAYRRFLQMYSQIVLGLPSEPFDGILEESRSRERVDREIDLSPAALRDVAARFEAFVKERTGTAFPQDPWVQLEQAIVAVFKSWNNARAVTYRREYRIADTIGTAVNVQAMVFGNMGEDSASGVAFTRDSSTGERVLTGEFLTNSQGEDVVAGRRTPRTISRLGEAIPTAYESLRKIADLLERHYLDVQDIEFTVQRGVLYMLQTRTAKRTAQAAVRIAVEMAKEGLITREDALTRVQPLQLDQLLHRGIDPKARPDEIARGLNASPGAGSGEVVFSADEAETLAQRGRRVILVRTETNPDDVHGFFAAQGILTSRGGMSSHAAVVARGMGKPCVSGCESIKVDVDGGLFRVGGRTVRRGDILTIDGSTGRVFAGEVPTVEPSPTPEFLELLSWADDVARLGVRANADTPPNAQRARQFGAVGIGLCRTERMFNEPDRLPIVREMILAESPAERQRALDKLLPIQKADFLEIFRAMDGFPVTVRTIDPPLHEFLPMKDDLLEAVTRARALGQESPEIEEKARFLRKVIEIEEQNPMLGLRGCRLQILYPEIIRMQTRAVIEACCELSKEGVTVRPEIMIPLVSHANELKALRAEVEQVAQAVQATMGVKLDLLIGTMMEIPRACLTADAVAAHADFFSFGTNDLTQTTFGYSRDDAEGAFLFGYLEKGILSENPFEVLDRSGVGKLVELAVSLGRATKPKLKIGICGEHGGDPRSIEFFHGVGLDYVSCSAFRVPVARLAAAHAALKGSGRKVVDVTV